jgi:hypothetical protein
VLVGVVVARLEGAQVQLGRLDLLAELLAQRVLHLRHVDAEELREHPVVDHVLDQPAELRVLADLGHDPVVGDRSRR